jgi:hypothetical protein
MVIIIMPACEGLVYYILQKEQPDPLKTVQWLAWNIKRQISLDSMNFISFPSN